MSNLLTNVVSAPVRPERSSFSNSNTGVRHGAGRHPSVDLKGIVMTTGTVKFFNTTKGFGFIEQGNGQPDVFVHISAVERSGMRTLVEGQKVNFEVVTDRRNGKSAAENLSAA